MRTVSLNHLAQTLQGLTHHTNKTLNMPLRSQRLNHHLCNRASALLTFRAVPINMAIHAPRIPVLLHERRRAIKRIPALGTKKVSNVPLRTTSNHNFTFDGRLAGLATGRE